MAQLDQLYPLSLIGQLDLYCLFGLSDPLFLSILSILLSLMGLLVPLSQLSLWILFDQFVPLVPLCLYSQWRPSNLFVQ